MSKFIVTSSRRLSLDEEKVEGIVFGFLLGHLIIPYLHDETFFSAEHQRKEHKDKKKKSTKLTSKREKDRTDSLPIASLVSSDVRCKYSLSNVRSSWNSMDFLHRHYLGDSVFDRENCSRQDHELLHLEYSYGRGRMLERKRMSSIAARKNHYLQSGIVVRLT